MFKLSHSWRAKTFSVGLLFLSLFGTFQNIRSQVLKNETRITIDNKNRKKTVKTVSIQINNKSENSLAHVEIRHSPLQDFSFGHARIIDFQGNTLRKIRKKDLTTRNDLSYAAFYQDDLITEFDLYWHQYPYTIEYSYTIEEREFIYLSWWTPVLFSSVPTLKGSLEVNVPLDYKINVSQTDDVVFTEAVIADRKILQWNAAFDGDVENEIFSPPVQESIPVVRVVPENLNYGVPGSTESWSTFGSWLNELNEGTDLLPLREKHVIKRLIKDSKDQEEIVRRLYHYLQDHTRYINVAIDVGGLKSYPADYVCTNKYGDCKALTTYMKSMLKSVGIKSYYTVINAGKNEARINTDLPGQQFNHVILAVPLQKDTIWLENTSGSLPFNYLGTFTQDRYALAVGDEKSELITTPELKLPDVLVERDYKYLLDEKKVWQSQVTLILRGDAFEDFRHALLKQDKEDKLVQVNKSLGVRGFEVREWSLMDFHRDSSSVKIQVSGLPPNPVREIGSMKIINPLKISIPDFEDPDKRTLEVRVRYPINRTDKTEYHLPFEAKDVQIPEGITLKGDYGEYSVSFHRENNSIITREKFTLLKKIIAIEEYPQFYSFLQSIINYKKTTAILIQ
ncbi:DUF3857 domain-containing protein [Salinimicrobium sp. HB62]|uniref:DUF3857 domain-containing protein n=1 Tax=Salinimicrobium sp. HB62 TaxID=3077781 RepID=UPI002D7A30FD|nr:DUF3857 domain-containing protein [Salinimicrobium sp. HB62]